MGGTLSKAPPKGTEGFVLGKRPWVFGLKPPSSFLSSASVASLEGKKKRKKDEAFLAQTFGGTHTVGDQGACWAGGHPPPLVGSFGITAVSIFVPNVFIDCKSVSPKLSHVWSKLGRGLGEVVGVGGEG